ncbi:amino acid/polyamine transporter I [Ilyonectria destructans]|nr:amino acid/polyamine transporter I [Ilyonectria destructans]
MAATEHDSLASTIQHSLSGELPSKVKYGTKSLSIFAVVLPSVWSYAASTYATGLYAGGMPIFIHGTLGVGFALSMVCVSLAEFGSAFPSTAGCTYIATKLGGPNWGRIAGFFTGGFHLFGSLTTPPALIIALSQNFTTAVNILHPSWTPERWQTFLIYLFWNAFFLVFTRGGGRFLNKLSDAGGFLVFTGLFVTIGLMLGYTTAENSSSFVWSDFQNFTGWNDGICALLGLSAPMYSYGPVHWLLNMAEEVRDPRRSVPIAIAWQQIGNIATLFAFYVAAGYAVVNWQELVLSTYQAPVGALFEQALGSRGGAAGLLFVIVFMSLFSVMAYISANIRLCWAFAKTGALPYQEWLCKLDKRDETPNNVLYVQSVVNIIFGLIYVGSPQGFWIILGSSGLSFTMGYLSMFIVYVATKGKYMTRNGWFKLPRPVSISFALFNICFLLLQCIIYALPPIYPVTAKNMNYSCVFGVAMFIFLSVVWVISGRQNYVGYPEPTLIGLRVMDLRVEECASGSRSEAVPEKTVKSG